MAKRKLLNIGWLITILAVVFVAGNASAMTFEKLSQEDLMDVMLSIQLNIDEGESEAEESSETTPSYMSWGIEAMGLDNAIQAIEEKGDANHLLVAVIDTGVKTAVFNEYFPERTLYEYCVITCENGMDDTVGHGTHVIGTIAEGTASNVDLLMIRVSTDGNFSVGNLLTAIRYAVEQGVDVINISAGSPLDLNNETYNSQYGMTWGEIYRQIWEIEKGVIDEATEAGAIVVAAAGSGTDEHEEYPASFDSAISVTSVNPSLAWANLSPHNQYIDFAGPGTKIYSLNYRYTGEEGQSIQNWNQGSSMAAPHLTAAVAALKSFNIDLTFENVMELLRSKAIDLGDEGRDDYYGYGFVDFSEAEFCISGRHCDEYGVFQLEGPFEDDEEPETLPEEDPNETEAGTGGSDDATEESDLSEIVVPNTGVFTVVSESVAAMSFVTLVVVGIGLATVNSIIRR